MMVDDDYLLIHLHAAVVHLAYADASHIFIIIDGADQHLGAGFGVALGSRDIVQDSLKQGNHAASRFF